jgi:CSLREA domain-containing protein
LARETSIPRRFLMMLLIVFLSVVPVSPGPALSSASETSYSVTRFDDPVPDGCSSGDCSLREAVVAANSTPGHDAITLGPGNYALALPGSPGDATTGDLNISEDLTIAGAGVSSTLINGAQLANRILNIGAPAIVTVEGLTIRDSTAGGLLNSGSLTLQNVSVTTNTTDALTHGGGIDNSGLLTLANVTLSGNRAGTDGGGIFNSGSATLTNVTVSGNKGDRGGGLYNSGNATLNGATVARNTANAGGAGGGGLFTGPGGTLRLENTMVANNIDASSTNHTPDCLGSLVSAGYNFVENTVGCAGITGPGDITGLDPKLGQLLDNGGPTHTQTPAADSPVIDAGNPATAGSGSGACTASDQRGAPRALGGRCDIGAVEQVMCLGTPVRRVGTLGDDSLVGTLGPDAILGLSGNDSIDSGGGNDRVCAGEGNDVVEAGSGDDVLHGDQGNDQLRGGFGKDTLSGAEGRDLLEGGSSDDSIGGGAEDDVLTGGPGNDVLRGDEGKDSLTGDTGRDELLGGTGNDVLHGGTEDDSLHGESDADTLYGEDGNDSLTGDQGVDLVDGGEGNDRGQGGSGDDSLFGRDGSDVLHGQAGRDRLQGGMGNDNLLGGAQADRIVGGDNKDLLKGGSGPDVLIGGRGGDILRGGKGNDRCVGGPGQDRPKDCEKGDALFAL